GDAQRVDVLVPATQVTPNDPIEGTRRIGGEPQLLAPRFARGVERERVLVLHLAITRNRRQCAEVGLEVDLEHGFIGIVFAAEIRREQDLRHLVERCAREAVHDGGETRRVVTGYAEVGLLFLEDERRVELVGGCIRQRDAAAGNVFRVRVLLDELRSTGAGENRRDVYRIDVAFVVVVEYARAPSRRFTDK